jgi:hypothetical protein
MRADEDNEDQMNGLAEYKSPLDEHAAKAFLYYRPKKMFEG